MDRLEKKIKWLVNNQNPCAKCIQSSYVKYIRRS